MKLLILVGNDILGVEYSSKKSAILALTRAADFASYPKGSIDKNNGHLACRYKGRQYTESELRTASVVTPAEYWSLCRP